jgi:hypothetical protein
MIEIVSDMPAPQFGTNLRECEDQLVQGSSGSRFRFDCCKMFLRIPEDLLVVEDHWFNVLLKSRVT